MSRLQWTADLDTGIEVIDSQHRSIVDYINRLHDAVEKRNREEIASVFDELVDYTATHFSFEEGLQEQAGYPYRAAHQRVHQVFIKKLDEHKRRFEQGDMSVAYQLIDMLRNWLVGHIKNDDADYVESVRKVIDSGENNGWISRSLKRLFG